MKRFIVFALMGLVFLFAAGMLASTDFAHAVKEKVTMASAGDCGTAILATGLGAAVIAGKGGETQAQGEAKEKTAREKLWIIDQPEFDDLEAKYRKLYVIDVAIDADERYQFIARRPSKDLIDSLAACKDNINEVTDTMIKNMLVRHSRFNPEELEDGVVYQHVLTALTAISRQGKQLFTKA
ncbi:hypothetical protein [Dysgonomonas termitidis]|uniref:Uncharacterized protein n=1 Tax=Dysgonomonas termitidis TaxID=1516126 RepID=A0ABV9KU84_9BACT